MNSTTVDSRGGSSSNSSSSNTSFRKEAIDNLAYSVGFSVVVLVVLMIVSYVSYKCSRSWSSSSSRFHTTTNADAASSFSLHAAHSINIIPPEDSGASADGGLDEAALVNYPKFLYSQAKIVRAAAGDGDDPVIVSGCSICLADYKDSDMLRLLPECGHLFHLSCIDPWLKLHPTCPLCRSSPMPTPLAEVVPLSLHPN